ncbi:PDC sensor domain-containing protein [Roseovarius sp. B08]|uniref:PDC sensor domain-containing protein n=1 Tax=Roseovarius sp. B08 TaxID=3449223 RepID=UPI003EDB98C4
MKKTLTTLAATILVATGAQAAGEYDGALTDLANSTIAAWVADPVVLGAVRAQNVSTASLTEHEIIALDATWRQQTVSGGDLVDTVLSNTLSAHLKDIHMQGAGRYTEIFVTDIRGLNVGQSGITSDYWQGDEAKWQVPHETSGIHIGDIEFDESTQSYQSQVSVPIMDDGSFVGVITVGVNVEMLASAN